MLRVDVLWSEDEPIGVQGFQSGAIALGEVVFARQERLVEGQRPTVVMMFRNGKIVIIGGRLEDFF